MKLLGVETSSPVFSVAAAAGDGILSLHQAEGAGHPSSGLAPLIERVMAEAGWGWQDLSGLVLSIGPGSFTGLRVGVTMVKTLAWALQKPVVPVSTLEVIAQNFQGAEGPEVRLFLDARKGKVYTARFRPAAEGFLQRTAADRLTLPEEALRDLPEGTWLVGDGLRRYGELVRALGGGKVRMSEPATWIPRADWLCRLGSRVYASGRLDDARRLVPQYLYSEKSDITGW